MTCHWWHPISFGGVGSGGRVLFNGTARTSCATSHSWVSFEVLRMKQNKKEKNWLNKKLNKRPLLRYEHNFMWLSVFSLDCNAAPRKHLCNGLYRKASPKTGTFITLQVYTTCKQKKNRVMLNGDDNEIGRSVSVRSRDHQIFSDG